MFTDAVLDYIDSNGPHPVLQPLGASLAGSGGDVVWSQSPGPNALGP